MPVPVEFWFEYASTYSYLSAMRIEHVCSERGVKLIWKPFLLGPIFSSQGWRDSPFNIYTAKGEYMWADMAREAARLGLPFNKPRLFPQSGLTAARITCAHAKADWIGQFVRDIYTANFVTGSDISDPLTLATLLNPIVPDPASVLSDARSEAVKMALRDQTEQAAKLGIFGAPTFRVGGEIYWGNDRLDQALLAALANA